MSTLIGVHRLSKSFGAKILFEDIGFGVETGERIGLIGPNGAGKTTLLNILGGHAVADSGTVSYQKGLRVAFLQQMPVFDKDRTVWETIYEGARCLENPHEDWELELRVEELISRFGLDRNAQIATLSGGWRKKTALARELAKKPDLLLLDEPTNHLDVESILWLEEFLEEASFAAVTVTHDRFFLQKVSTRILELDRRNPDGLLSVKGNYGDYLLAKEQLMNAQEKRESALRNTLRRETEWLRRGPKARTTKQQARIDRAYALQETVVEISERNQSRVASMDFQKSTLPKKLLEAKGIEKTYGKRTLFSDFDLLLSPGVRVGILGENGVGKSTLIRVLLGQEKQDRGEVFRSDQLSVAYFEQNREALNPNDSVARAVCPEGDYVDYRGQRLHIQGYLDRFLFSASERDLPVSRLSGGEQSRLLIARLMLKPANLLVLDEPTNDLDLATLSILQECLVEFEGAILLVTHDRWFLQQVANKIVAFPSDTPRLPIFADLPQWEEWMRHRHKEKSRVADESPRRVVEEKTPQKSKKLSYKDQRELEGMEDKIIGLEEEMKKLQKESEEEAVVSDANRLTELFQEIDKRKQVLESLYLRWEELLSLSK